MKGNSKDKHSAIASYLLPLLPILNIYKVKGISILSFGEIVLVIVLISILFTHKIYLKNKFYLIFLLYTIVSSLVMIFLGVRENYTEVITRLLREIFYGFCFVLFTDNDILSWTKVKKSYMGTSIIVIIILYIQYFVTLMFNKHIFFWIPIFPLNVSMSNSEFYSKVVNDINLGLYRSSSIFTEPSHFAQYIVPLLIISAFYEKNLKLELLVIGSIFISESSNGIFVLLVVLMIQVVVGVKQYMNYLPLFLISLFIVFFVSRQLNYIEIIKDKFLNFGDVSSYTSANIRIYRGFFLFLQFPLCLKVFGIGSGNIVMSINKLKIIDLFPNAGDYVNSISYILISTGMIGFFLYILNFNKYLLGKYNDLTTKTMVMVFFLLMATSSLYVSPMYLFLLLMIDFIYKENMENERYNFSRGKWNETVSTY